MSTCRRRKTCERRAAPRSFNGTRTFPPSSRSSRTSGFRPLETDDQAQEVELVDEALVLRTWSDLDTIANKDFAELTAEELRHGASRDCERLTWNIDERRTRRWVAGPRQPHRSASRARAQPSHRRRNHRAAAPTRGGRGRGRSCCSATSAARWSATRGRCCCSRTRCRAAPRDVEAFLFATRLTRITMELRAPKPDAAMAAVSRAVTDWSGGTRIGDALRDLPSALAAPHAARQLGRAPDFRRLGSRRSAACSATRSRGCSAAATG